MRVFTVEILVEIVVEYFFKKAFLVYLPSVGRRRRGRECGGGPSADAARRRRIGQRKVEVHIARSLEKELSSIRKKVLFFLCSIFFAFRPSAPPYFFPGNWQKEEIKR